MQSNGKQAALDGRQDEQELEELLNSLGLAFALLVRCSCGCRFAVRSETANEIAGSDPARCPACHSQLS